jgi:hypothetical protein
MPNDQKHRKVSSLSLFISAAKHAKQNPIARYTSAFIFDFP